MASGQEGGQNVDNLHLRSGIRPELLAELHGNVSKLRCTRCQTQMDKSSGMDTCKCGGRLVSSVVNFGDPLPQKDLEDSFRHSSRCDLFVVVGSSLVVSPANDMPRLALRSGARLSSSIRERLPWIGGAIYTLKRR
jgi:NAD-dependent deacetylase